eukprot:PhF_6_TR9735/c0_g1_i1/m.14992
MSRPRIVLFGDSITEQSFSLDDKGWGAVLAGMYTRKADIINRGLSGYNTRWALHMIPKYFPAGSNIEAVTLCFGANDASLAGINDFQHVPLPEFEANLKQIIHHLKGVAKHVIVLSCPPMDPVKWLIAMKQKYGGGDSITQSNRSNEATRTYAEAAKRVAAEVGVSFGDVYTAISNEREGDYTSLLSDGLHLNADGNAVMAKVVVECLNGLGLTPGLLPMDMPHHSEVNGSDLQGTFAKYL